MSPREVVPDLDPRWEAVIMSSSSAPPRKRYQTAAEVEAALTGAARRTAARRRADRPLRRLLQPQAQGVRAAQSRARGVDAASPASQW